MEKTNLYIEFFIAYLFLYPIYFYLGKRIRINSTTLFIIYIYRAIFSCAYILYSQDNPADASMYLNYEGEGIEFGLGTINILNIIFILKNLGIPDYSIYGFFGLIGSIGFIYIYKLITMLERNNRGRIRLASIIICFLPSFAFWTVAPGKEPLCFLLISIIIYNYASLIIINHNSNNNNDFNIPIISSIIILGIIRPHVGLCFALGYFSRVFLNLLKKRGFTQRFILILLFICTFIILIPILLKFAALELLDINNASEILTSRFSQRSSTLNLSPYHIRFITYLFPPLPLINTNPLQLIEGVQSIFILFYLFLIFRKKNVFKNIIQSPLFMYSIFATALLSFITFNIGLSARQRWLILPVLFTCMLINKYKNEQSIREKA